MAKITINIETSYLEAFLPITNKNNINPKNQDLNLFATTPFFKEAYGDHELNISFTLTNPNSLDIEKNRSLHLSESNTSQFEVSDYYIKDMFGKINRYPKGVFREMSLIRPHIFVSSHPKPETTFKKFKLSPTVYLSKLALRPNLTL
uniref:Uncharacterized protein n=1 Tax=Lactuca sativa TaxID=4236 RepID=A0A9R1VLJ7_LACSA|nr:hypothetical protein LSAT_V11C500235630 [Lactuca sativa]